MLGRESLKVPLDMRMDCSHYTPQPAAYAVTLLLLGAVDAWSPDV